MTNYIWQTKDWPNLSWSSDQIIDLLGLARRKQGDLLALADQIGITATADVIAQDVVATSAIEGESLSLKEVRSSVAQRLGLPEGGLTMTKNPMIEGIVDLVLDATQSYENKLTEKRLCGWHASLFPNGYSGMYKIGVGAFRKGPEEMRVVSGKLGHEKTHFIAPPSDKIKNEVSTFLKWFEDSRGVTDGILRAALAHFKFVTIHPFDDGNGRISRAIADMSHAQDEESSRRLYSISSQIMKQRKSYYEILEACQKGESNITEWILWYLEVFQNALVSSKKVVDKVKFIHLFWRKLSNVDINPRQKKVIQKLLETEPGGFEGGLTNKKYVAITKTSSETAKRDLADLLKKNLILKNPGRGRSTNYSLNNKITD